MTSMNAKIYNNFTGMYDILKNDNDEFISIEKFEQKVNELVELGFIEIGTHDDSTLYSARHGLNWSEFVHIDDSDKKNILLLLVQNPITFFILVNTQQGKMRIASLEIKKWGDDKQHRVVAFIVVDNDKTLAEQSTAGLLDITGKDEDGNEQVKNEQVKNENEHVKIFSLSSNNKIKINEIIAYIDAYSMFQDYKMPVIALLSNPTQCEKMVKILHHITKRIRQNKSNLRYGMIWDEADKTYNTLRDKHFSIEGISLSCRDFIVENNEGLYRLGFVSATDGDLLTEDYPECANAWLYPADISAEDKEHYRAFHHPEAIVKCIPISFKQTNNSYADEILSQLRDPVDPVNPQRLHFAEPIILPSGELYYRKIIVNSNSRTNDMKELAMSFNEKDMYAFVFNSMGSTSVKVYRPGMPVILFKTKGRRLNEALFYLYKKLGLHDKPIVIIGRRKVDRGLGFHYCPRKNDEHIIKDMDGYGDLITRDREGLIWTDEILGHIEDKDIAVQKAGRLAGIIGNSPQYCGSITFWTDDSTATMIRRHNTIVEHTNTITGCSVLQAVSHAEDRLNSINPPVKVNHRVGLERFLVYDNPETTKRVCEIMGYAYRNVSPTNGFRLTSLNAKRCIASLIDAIEKVPTAYGTNQGITTYRTYIPCYKNVAVPESEHFVIIIREHEKEDTKLRYAEAIRQYPPIIIPQTGDY